MRLIDADALKKEWSLGDKCEECPQNAWKCQFEQNLTQMDICQMIDEAPTVSGWVRVEDRLPETRHAVLVYTPHHKNIWAASMHEDGNWYIWSPGNSVLLDPDWYGPITHWMLTPEPPKEDEKHGR